MDVYRRITVYMFICLIFVTLSNTEIHRVKSNPLKHGLKISNVKDSSYVAGKLDALDKDISQKEFREKAMLDIKLETWLYSIFGAILVGLSGIFPLLVIPLEAGPGLKHGAAAARLKLLLSFAVGGLLGDVFLHLLPEAWEHIHAVGSGHEGHMKLGLWVLAGMLSFLIIEKIFAKEDEFEHLEDECAEAEEEDRQFDCQCQPLHKELTDSPSIHTDSVANRTRQRSKLNKQTASTNNDKDYATNRTAQQNQNCKNGNNHITTRLDTQQMFSHNQTVQNHQTSQMIHSKTNGTVHTTREENSQVSSIKVVGYLNLAANVIDNFTHGLAVAGGFLVSSKVGFITIFAILLHEVPHEVGDFAILLRSGFNRWQAAKAQLLTATGGLIGALTALLADSAQAAGESTVWILPFTSGGFIYIALVTVVPDVLNEKHPKESTKQILSLMAGVGVMYLVALVH